MRRAALAVLWLITVDVLSAQALKLFPRLASSLESKYWVYSPWLQHTFYPYVDRPVPWLGGEYRLRTNSLGLKDREPREIAKTSDRPRILVVGDSFAEGQGLPWEESAVGRIATALAVEGVEVLNAGTFHTNVLHYRNKVRHLLDREGLSISHVVVFLDISDIPESLNSEIAADGRILFPGMMEARFKHLLKTNSIILRTVAVAWDLLHEPMRNTTPLLGVDVYDSDWTVNPAKRATVGQRGLETCQRWLDDLRAYLAQRNVGMTLMVYPWATQLWHDDLDSIQRRIWKAWAERQGVEFIDLFPDYFDSAPAAQRIERWYFPRDVHFNAAGAEKMAAGFLARFQTKAAVSPPTNRQMISK